MSFFQIQSISKLLREMGSNSIPVTSGSDPDLVKTLSTRAGSPPIEPVTRPSAGPTVLQTPTGATSPPGKKVEETIQANNGKQPNGECTLQTHLPDATVY